MAPLIAALIVFFASAAVLVLEILAVRLLAPHLGVTLEVTTGVIGTVLAGIAIGTWLGGRLADEMDPRRLLGPILILGGVLAIAVIPIVTLAASMGLSPDPVGILLFAGAAFFLPAAVLSAASPTVVKLQLRHLSQTGSVVGRYSAIGTAGAIAGSFVTGFVLVAALPTRPIIIGLGLALVVVGVLIAVTVGRARGSGVAAVAACPGGQRGRRGRSSRRVRASARAPTSASAWPRARRRATASSGWTRCGMPTWTWMTRRTWSSPTRACSATSWTLLAPAGEPIRGLHLGGGGFTMPRYIAATRPGSVNRVLELDPVVLQTAREELGLETSDDLTVRLGDARISLADEPTDAYDLVIGDAFAGPAVPWHLTTRELAAEVQRVLRPGGIYAVNIIDYPPLRLARAQLATFAEVFDHVAVFGPESRVAGTSGGNVILLASDEPFPAEALAWRRTALEAARHHFAAGGRGAASGDDAALIADFIDGAVVLTDDFAPLTSS